MKCKNHDSMKTKIEMKSTNLKGLELIIILINYNDFCVNLIPKLSACMYCIMSGVGIQESV